MFYRSPEELAVAGTVVVLGYRSSSIDRRTRPASIIFCLSLLSTVLLTRLPTITFPGNSPFNMNDFAFLCDAIMQLSLF